MKLDLEFLVPAEYVAYVSPARYLLDREGQAEFGGGGLSQEYVFPHYTPSGQIYSAFIIAFSVVSSVYVALNVMLGKRGWDPYPYILLNLFLSLLAAIQAPVIMMSQNRQDKKDRLRSELDYDVNRRAASEIQGLARKLNLMNEKLGDLEDLLRLSPK